MVGGSEETACSRTMDCISNGSKDYLFLTRFRISPGSDKKGQPGPESIVGRHSNVWTHLFDGKFYPESEHPVS